MLHMNHICAIFHDTAISYSSHYAIIPRACLKFMTMAFGYVPQGFSGMSYCNQTPFPPREVWGLGMRLGMYMYLYDLHTAFSYQSCDCVCMVCTHRYYLVIVCDVYCCYDKCCYSVCVVVYT